MRCLILIWCGLSSIHLLAASSAPVERTFPQSKATVEKALKGLQSVTAGRLPTLEGFTVPDERPFAQFSRGYYQCTVRVEATPPGGTRVRVSAKITAWYADSVASRSGYQVLPSNGRLEGDLLDQLQDSLGKDKPGALQSVAPARKPIADDKSPPSAPTPQFPQFALHGVARPSRPDSGPEALKNQTDAEEKRERDLATEAKNLEEILDNQSRPDNLAAVKKTGTPVLQNPNAGAHVLFAATAGDEFEVLDVTADWVHVRIVGLSRGWILRSALEMPGNRDRSTQSTGGAAATSSVPFRVTREQFATFPGDWPSLLGKTVRIVSVQKIDENAKDAGPQAKLEFAKAVLHKQYAAAAGASEGIVLIFDSEDGGMVAATLQSLQQWITGALPDDAFWRQCFFDPPEAFISPAHP